VPATRQNEGRCEYGSDEFAGLSAPLPGGVNVPAFDYFSERDFGVGESEALESVAVRGVGARTAQGGQRDAACDESEGGVATVRAR